VLKSGVNTMRVRRNEEAAAEASKSKEANHGWRGIEAKKSASAHLAKKALVEERRRREAAQ